MRYYGIMSISRFFLACSLFILGAANFAFVSCGGRISVAAGGVGSADGVRAEKASVQPWRTKSSTRILAVVGQDFAESDAIVAPLLAEYGSASDGGAVVVMMYPESFKVDGIVRISRMAEAAGEHNADILVSVGIPEGCVNALGKARDANASLRVLTLLPREETLSMEALSDLVIDPEISSGMLDEEKAPVVPEADLGLLLFSAVLAAEKDSSVSGKIASNVLSAESLDAALASARKRSGMKTACPDWTFASYVDPESGLKARNHLVFRRLSGEAQP